MMILSFQSTPSAWRETHTPPKLHQLPHISIHSLRMEGDPVSSGKTIRQSISIHSLRMEGDNYVFRFENGKINFNPLPPHGGRPYFRKRPLRNQQFQSTPSAWRETIRLYLTVHMESVFQSTPSAWRETYRKSLPVDNIEISIHSLRMEGDLFIRN